MSGRPTRREALAAAAIAFTGASVKIPVRHPDAELLDACAQYHRRRAAVCTPGVSDEEGRAADKAWDAAHERVAALTPQTGEGMRAKAGVAFQALLWKVSGRLGAPWREQADMHETLAIEVLRDVSGLPEPPPKPLQKAAQVAAPRTAWVSPDASLMALCDDAMHLDAQKVHLGWCEDWEHPTNAHRRSAGPSAKAAFAAVQQRYGEVLQEIAGTPAQTLFGFRAKAAVLLTFYGDDLPEERTNAGAVLASLLHGLAGEEA